jgi:hypothetical protein
MNFETFNMLVLEWIFGKYLSCLYFLIFPRCHAFADSIEISIDIFVKTTSKTSKVVDRFFFECLAVGRRFSVAFSRSLLVALPVDQFLREISFSPLLLFDKIFFGISHKHKWILQASPQSEREK